MKTIDNFLKIVRIKNGGEWMETTEAEKRKVVERLEMIRKALPHFIELAKEGKITKVPHEGMYIIEAPTSGVNSANVKEFSVIFPLCPSSSFRK